MTLATDILHRGPFNKEDVVDLWKRSFGPLVVKRTDGTWGILVATSEVSLSDLSGLVMVFGCSSVCSDSDRIEKAKHLEAEGSPSPEHAALAAVAQSEQAKMARDEVIAAVRGGRPLLRKYLKAALTILLACVVAHAAVLGGSTVIVHATTWAWVINKQIVALFPNAPDFTKPASVEK